MIASEVFGYIPMNMISGFVTVYVPKNLAGTKDTPSPAGEA
jgi:hypothetical protein